MPNVTPNLGLKKPLGNENVSRQVYNETLDLLDQNAAKKTDLAAHLADYTQQIKTDSKQSVTLPHGLSIVNATRTSRLFPTKIRGRQLCNLLGRDGNCEDVSKWSAYDSAILANDPNTVNRTQGTKSIYYIIASGKTGGGIFKSVPLSAGKYYIAIADVAVGTIGNIRLQLSGVNGAVVTNTQPVWNTVYVKLQQPTDANVDLFVYSTSTTAGKVAYVDAIRLYEITAAEYAEIDNMPPEQVAAKYPYVDGFQCVRNPAVRAVGGNLLPPFSQWNLHTNAKVVDPHKLELNATANGQYSSCKVRVRKNTNYTVKITHNGTTAVYDERLATIILEYATANERVFNSGNNDYVNVIVANDGGQTGIVSFSNPMLFIGDQVPTEFKPYDPSHLYLQTDLYEGETIEWVDGKPVRTKKWERKVLDGSLNWTLNSQYPGIKVVDLPIPDAVNSQTHKIAKYDGKLLKVGSVGAPGWDVLGGDHTQYWQNATQKLFQISISNSDSGWGENYIPTPDEIKACFMGWTMFEAVSHTLYNGTGEKAWAKIYSGNGTREVFPGGQTIVSGTGTKIIPTTMNDQGYIPYTLHYQLAKPTTEVVPYEGQLVLHEGLNQVEVFEGVVVRELVNPEYNYESDYIINQTGYGKLKNKAHSLLSVFKGNLADNVWLHATNLAYGKDLAYTNKQNFDPTAQYSVTYIALREEFTAPLLAVEATYDSNIKSTVDTLVDELAKVTTDVTALEMTLRNKGLLKKTPTARIRINNQQSIPNDSWTLLAFDTVDFDTNGIVLDVSKRRLTVKTPGVYLVLGVLGFSKYAGGYRELLLRKNGSESINRDTVLVTSLETNAYLQVETVEYLTENDYLDMLAYQNCGTGPLNVFSCRLTIVKVGD